MKICSKCLKAKATTEFSARMNTCKSCHKMRMTAYHKSRPKETLAAVEWKVKNPDRVLRELICSSCNTALGLLKENPELFHYALAYLTKHATSIEKR